MRYLFLRNIGLAVQLLVEEFERSLSGYKPSQGVHVVILGDGVPETSELGGPLAAHRRSTAYLASHYVRQVRSLIILVHEQGLPLLVPLKMTPSRIDCLFMATWRWRESLTLWSGLLTMVLSWMFVGAWS